MYMLYKNMYQKLGQILALFLKIVLDIFGKICYTIFTGKGTVVGKGKQSMANNNEHKEEALRNANNTINTAKDRLLSIVWELEEAGLKRKAKSLYRLVGELELWQHK